MKQVPLASAILNRVLPIPVGVGSGSPANRRFRHDCVRCESPQCRAGLKRWLTVALLGFASALGAISASAASSTAELARRVVILANSRDPGSLQVARHYAAVRGVPERNLVALPMSVDETTTWRDFVPQIWNPLLERLVREGWIDAIPMELHDDVGRRKYSVSGHHIAALVVCRGVPLRIAHDPALYADVPPFTSRGEFRTNAACVDGELALLAAPNHPINAFVVNPLFAKDSPTAFEEQQVVKVSRLDGPTVADALSLVDRAVAAEETGLLGRAYIDLSNRDEIGNAWLEKVAAQVRALGFDTDVDRDPATMPATARCDAPVLYFGWYAENLNGPFALPGFRFPPGAIALHIHSYSANTLRSTTAGWTGPLVARGVTATVGNVYEPYLQLTHRPDLLMRALARGDRLVDAAFYALQGLSWQDVLIGDPLYRPFAVTVEQQLAIAQTLPAERAGYAAIRRANQLDLAGKSAAGTELLREWQRRRPNLAVDQALAKRLLAAGDTSGATAALGGSQRADPLRTDEWALAADTARQLLASTRFRHGLDLWRRLLQSDDIPAGLRSQWLLGAAAAADAAGDTAQRAAWRNELSPAAGAAAPP